MPDRNATVDSAARQRIIESAITLFARDGVDGVPLRELTAHAGVNLAAVNYHFGSKEALAKIVFEELSKRVNQRRLKRLEQLLAQADEEGRAPRLEDIVTSFIEPYVATEYVDEGRLLARLILRHRLTPTDMTSKLMRKHFDPMAKKYIAALAAACPDVPGDEFYWRYTFMVSTVVLTVTDRSSENRLVKLSGGAADPSDPNKLIAAMLRFVCGGMRADAERTDASGTGGASRAYAGRAYAGRAEPTRIRAKRAA